MQTNVVCRLAVFRVTQHARAGIPSQCKMHHAHPRNPCPGSFPCSTYLINTLLLTKNWTERMSRTPDVQPTKNAVVGAVREAHWVPYLMGYILIKSTYRSSMIALAIVPLSRLALQSDGLR